MKPEHSHQILMQLLWITQERLTRAVYAALRASRGYLNPLAVQAHCAGWAGKTHAGPVLGAAAFS